MNSNPAQSALLPPELLTQLERMELVSRKIFRGRMKGERRSKRKGQSVEFADFRNYVPGDDLRFIDWNLYARLDKLFLKLFLEEEDLHFYALVDCSPSMEFGDPSKFFYAKQLAAALGYIGLCRSDRVRIEPLGLPVARAAPVLRGRSSLWRMIDYLDKIPCGGTTNLSDSVIQVLSQAEIDPDLKGDLRLVDIEDQDFAEVSISPRLLDKYRRTLAAFIEGAREFCAKRGITYMMTSTERPVDRLISRYLRQRGLVR